MNDGELEAMDKNEDGTIDYWEEREWLDDKNTMSVHNAVLWSLASLFEQGGERHPRSISSKIIAGVWWLGALIIIQSYTANLAAFLTVKSSADDIKAISELANRGDVNYGTVSGHHVQSFFDSSKREPYKYVKSIRIGKN